MSLSEISHRLRRVAETLDSNAERLQRPKFLTQAAIFLKALGKFDSGIAGELAGTSPEVHEIETTLNSLFGTTQDAKGVSQLTKSVFPKAVNPGQEESLGGYLSRVAIKTVELNKTEAMRQALQEIYNRRMENESFKNEEQLIKKVVLPTDLAPEELELEKARLLANPELLVRLAEAVSVKVRRAKSGKPAINDALFANLMKAAHRLDRNIQR
jgi:hypothetical protein